MHQQIRHGNLIHGFEKQSTKPRKLNINLKCDTIKTKKETSDIWMDKAEEDFENKYIKVP